MKSKAPCTTCPDICENAIKLYELYHLYKDEIPITRVGLRCPRTGEEYGRRFKAEELEEERLWWWRRLGVKKE